MADKFKIGNIVEFNKGLHKLSGNIIKVFHNRKRPTSYLVMTDFEIVEEKDLRLKELNNYANRICKTKNKRKMAYNC